MSEIPGDLKFMKSHEWARVEGDGKVTVGISDHAQGLLGDLVYVELPNVGDRVEAGNACAVVESVKAASDVYAPVSGTVTEVNAALADKPETINEDAYGEGWLFTLEIEEADQLKELLGPDDYAELLEEDDHCVRASGLIPDRPPSAAGFFWEVPADANAGALRAMRRASLRRLRAPASIGRARCLRNFRAKPLVRRENRRACLYRRLPLRVSRRVSCPPPGWRKNSQAIMWTIIVQRSAGIGNKGL